MFCALEPREIESKNKLFTSKLNFTVTGAVETAINHKPVPHDCANKDNGACPLSSSHANQFTKSSFPKMCSLAQCFETAERHIKISPLFMTQAAG